MNGREYLADRFEEHRPRLRALAYRMLGSLSEVDDAVQEAWLRLSRADATGIDNLCGWLMTVVGHVCLDMLRSRTSGARSRSRPPARSRRCLSCGVTRRRLRSLLAVLDPELVVRTDIAAPSAPSHVRGATVWAKQAVAFGHMARLARTALVDGTVGLVFAPQGRLLRALHFTIANRKITEIEVIGDPERLRRLDLSIVE